MTVKSFQTLLKKRISLFVNPRKIKGNKIDFLTRNSGVHFDIHVPQKP